MPAEQQFTTAITLGELVYGAARRGSAGLAERIRELIESLVGVLPFDESAAEIYGSLRAELEAGGQRLDEPNLRTASIAIANEVTLVSGNERHFRRVPMLNLENWLSEA